jgi:hypothetical protein
VNIKICMSMFTYGLLKFHARQQTATGRSKLKAIAIFCNALKTNHEEGNKEKCKMENSSKF